MNILFKSHNHVIDLQFKEYVISKITKITQFGISDTLPLVIKVSNENIKSSNSILKITLVISSESKNIRIETTAHHAKEAFDIALNKLIEKLRRHHDKRRHISKKGHNRKLSASDIFTKIEQ